MTRVFYIGCVLLHGAVQGWLILRLIDGMLEPKRTELQNRAGCDSPDDNCVPSGKSLVESG